MNTKKQNAASPVLARRTLFVGGATVGLVAAATACLPKLGAAPAVVAETQPAPLRGGGYSLSEHVKRYYQTTRL